MNHSTYQHQYYIKNVKSSVFNTVFMIFGISLRNALYQLETAGVIEQ